MANATSACSNRLYFGEVTLSRWTETSHDSSTVTAANIRRETRKALYRNEMRYRANGVYYRPKS